MIRNISVSCVKIFFKNCKKKESDKKRLKYIYTEPYMKYFHRFTLQHDKNTARATENKQGKSRGRVRSPVPDGVTPTGP